ncbi:MAG: hypothetical protein ACK4VV_10865 [Pseudomonas sp.]
MKHRLRYLVFLIPLLAHAAMLRANELQAELVSNPGAGQLFLIELPGDIDMLTLTRLAVEINGIDITAFLSFDEGSFLYSPPEPLPAGQHTIRLMLLKPDGSSAQVASWQITQPAGASQSASALPDAQQIAAAEQWLRSSSYSSNNSVEASYRIHDHNVPGATNRLQLSGGGASVAQLQSGNWQVDAQGTYLLQSQRAQSLTGEIIDIGEYSIVSQHQGQHFNTGVNLGHHSLGLDGLLFSPQQRRGLSVQAEGNNNRLSTQFFALRPDAIVGARHFDGVSDRRNRIQGLSTRVQPLSDDANALAITAMYYEGEGSTGGLGVTEFASVNKGSGWGLMLEKAYWQGRLNITGEHAHSRFNPDLNDNTNLMESSDAWRLKFDVRPFANLVWRDQPADVLLGAEYQRIDTFFSSMANPGLAADRDVAAVFSDLYWGRLSANLQLSHETNNVDQLQAMPTDRLRSLSWNGSYAFDPQTDSKAWLGTPYLHLSGLVGKLDRQRTPEGYQGFETDNLAESLTLGGGSSYESWQWSGSYTHAEFDDRSELGAGTRSRFLALAASRQVNQRLSLNSDMQYGIFDGKAEELRSYSTNLNMGMHALLIPDKLDLSLNYNVNLARGDLDLPDRHLINAQIGWTLLKASQRKPGVALALRGSMENNDETTSYSTGRDRYQIYAVLRISSPSAGSF